MKDEDLELSVGSFSSFKVKGESLIRRLCNRCVLISLSYNISSEFTLKSCLKEIDGTCTTEDVQMEFLTFDSPGRGILTSIFREGKG